MTKTESIMSIMSYIDDLVLDRQTYDIYKKMIYNMDDTLFVKVMEEIKNGSLSPSDFVEVLKNSNYSDFFEKNIIFQENLYTEYNLLMSRLIDLQIINKSTKLTNLASIEESDISNEKKNIIYSMLTENSENPYEAFFKNSLLQKYINNEIDFDTFLLSVHDYLVPIDYSHIELNKSDIEFMNENKLTEDEMKKIKSLSLLTE